MLRSFQNLKRLGSLGTLAASRTTTITTTTIKYNLHRGLADQASSSSSSSSNSDQHESEADFGYERVKYEEKQKKVNEVFTNVARKYDIMNDAMSFGLHRIWKNAFIQEINPNLDIKLLDVAGGTGDITFKYLSYLKNKYPSISNVKVTVTDINADMLNVGKERAERIGFGPNTEWRVGNAEQLVNEPDNTYDMYTIAFGIRNCTNIEKVVREAYRVLKPGGRFMCLEFSKTNNEVFQQVYDYYSFKMIPVMGFLIAGDWRSYQYLVESIRMFPNQDDFANLIGDCGFKLVSYKNLTNGIVAIHSGFKF